MAARFGIYQLRGDAHSIAHAPDTALDDEAHLQLARHLLHVHRHATKAERRSARATASERQRDNSVMMSSVMPSLK
jgi:hypothetical protein